MQSKEHETACERGMANLKRRAKLSRAQTYAFGQSSMSFSSQCSLAERAVKEEPASLPSLPSPGENGDGFPFPLTDAMDIDFSSSISIDSPLPAMPRLARRFDSY